MNTTKRTTNLILVSITGAEPVNLRQVHSAMMVLMEEELDISNEYLPSYQWDAVSQSLVVEHEGEILTFKRKQEPLPSS